MWQILKLMVIVYKKILLFEINIITIFLVFRMKHITDGICLFDYYI